MVQQQLVIQNAVLVILGVQSHTHTPPHMPKSPEACFVLHTQFHIMNYYSFSLLFLLISYLFSPK